MIRKHPRIATDIYLNKIIGDEPHLTRAKDISAGGIYLQKLLEPHLKESNEFGLEIKLPNSNTVIWAVGKVVRKETVKSTEGLAIRFERITESDRQLMSDYVISHRRAVYDSRQLNVSAA